MILKLIIFSLVAGVLGTGIGGFIGALFKKDSNRTMSLVLSGAGGIMLSVVCFDLIPTGFDAVASYSLLTQSVFVIGATIVGIVTVFLLNYFIDIYTERHHTNKTPKYPKTHDNLNELFHSPSYNKLKSENDRKKSLLNAGIIMLIAIGLHNFPEGLSIGSSYASAPVTGILLAILIALHDIPEGMAISVPLISGGMPKHRAVILTALSGLPMVIGAILGYYLGSSGPIGQVISLGFASGAMIYVIFCEILPQATLLYKSKAPAFFAIGGLVLGKLLMDSIDYIASII